jgi:hypothetical protein
MGQSMSLRYNNLGSGSDARPMYRFGLDSNISLRAKPKVIIN